MSGRITGATTTKGNSVAVATIVNQATAPKELKITIKDGRAVPEEGAEALTPHAKVPIFTGVTNMSETLGTGVTHTTKFESFANFRDYFAAVSIGVSHVVIQTDNTDNFNHSLIIEERDPTGKINEVEVDLTKYRQPSGLGWSNQVRVPLNQVFSPVSALRLSTLEAHSEVTMRFEIASWNKAQNMVALNSDAIN